MELKWLEDFLALARTGSFSRAANERNVTQPAFSRRIRALEHWLGVTLFDRSVSPIGLTQFGREFMPTAQEIVNSAIGMRQDFRMLARAHKQQVKIITLHTLSIQVVPGLIAPFLQDDPHARIEVLPSVQGIDAHFDALDSGLAHILIAYTQPRPALQESYLEKLVATDAFVPVVSKTYAEMRGLPDLAAGQGRHPLLAYSPFTFSHSFLSPIFERLEGRLQNVADAPLSETLKALVLRDIGLAWLPLTSIATELERGLIVRVPNEAFVMPMEIRAWRQRQLTHVLANRLWSALPDMAATPPDDYRTAAGYSAAPAIGMGNWS
jgi:LysR family transcriptional regulator, hypochlorite-specific transcription factor HypT